MLFQSLPSPSVFNKYEQTSTWNSGKRTRDENETDSNKPKKPRFTFETEQTLSPVVSAQTMKEAVDKMETESELIGDGTQVR